MSHLIPRLVKLHHDQMVMSSSLHITPSLHYRMTCPAPQSLLNQSFLVFRYLLGKYHVLSVTCSFSIMLYHPFSRTMLYAPILTHHWTNSFPMTIFSLCLADSFVPMTHFISLTILPIIHTLLDPFILYCCSIYGSHFCGVLSQPHFSHLSCIR